MTEAVLLDSGPLGAIAHHKPKSESMARLKNLRQMHRRVIVPEIIDYEVRRNLLLHKLHDSIAQLDQLATLLEYRSLDTPTLRLAAELWAVLRQGRRPTADLRSIDADVILAAQARRLGAVVVTANVRHLARIVPTVDWDAVPITP